jgi:hypothetical protein
VRYVLALILALAVVAPAPAQAFCFKEIGGVFHKPKAAAEAGPSAAYAGHYRPATAKPDSFCKVLGRSVAISVVVQTVVIVGKAALLVGTGVLIL